MYASLGDLVKDLFGINISFLYIFQMFGIMMAASFLVAAWLLAQELKRKEKQKLLFPVIRKTLVGAPATTTELILSGAGGFILGFKVIGIFLDLTAFIYDPQHFIFSWQGSWLGGIAVGALFAYLRYAEKQKVKLPEPKWETVTLYPHQLVGDLTIYVAIFGLIGAKLFDNLEHIDSFLQDPIGSLLSFSGLTFYGGLIFGATAGIIYCIRNKFSVTHMLDAVAPALIMAYAIGRIGCQVAGDGDWGIENTNPKPGWLSFMPDWFWAYTYPHNVNGEGVLIPGCVGKHCAELPVPVFPTPLYETIMCFIIFLFLWSIRKRLKIPGVLFSAYLILNGIERFLIEQIRVNSRYYLLGISATQAEIIALVMIVTGVVAAIYFSKRNKAVIAHPSS